MNQPVDARELGPVPLLEPLTYPGRWVDEATLLDGDVLRPLGDFPISAGRVPVLAIGSNGSPAQLSYKLRQAGVSGQVPMLPVRVTGLSVGLSAHISRVGYVAASPFLAADATSTLLVTWLDEDQLTVVDSTELPNYWRVFLPSADVPVARLDGEPMPGGGAFLYVNARGLLGRPDGSLRRSGEQRTVLAGLLAESARLRELFGQTPESWVERAREDGQLAVRGSEVFRQEGWLVRREEFRRFDTTQP